MTNINQLNQTQGRSLNLNTSATTSRRSVNNDFSSRVQRGVGGAAQAVAQGLSVAAPFVPGTAVVSAAVNQAAQGMSAGSLPISGGQVVSMGNLPGAAPGMTTSLGGGGAGMLTGNPVNDTMAQTRQMMEMSQNFNLEFLGIQQAMQDENRQFSTLSNVMKVKHDTAKASIQNIR